MPVHFKKKGFPYFEDRWEDRELFGGWFQDGSGQGQYGQDCPEPYLVRLFNRLERDAEARLAKSLVKELMPEDVQLMPPSQLQIEASLKRRRPRINVRWNDGLAWWQRLDTITVFDRILDPDILDEICRGDWD